MTGVLRLCEGAASHFVLTFRAPWTQNILKPLIQTDFVDIQVYDHDSD